jgi:hypothetical protein
VSGDWSTEYLAFVSERNGGATTLFNPAKRPPQWWGPNVPINRAIHAGKLDLGNLIRDADRRQPRVELVPETPRGDDFDTYRAVYGPFIKETG